MELSAELSTLAERLMHRLYPTAPAPIISHDPRTIAHHEAGHLVLAALFGTPAAGATITPTPDTSGMCWYSDAQPCGLTPALAVQPVAAFADHKLQVFTMAAIRYAGRQAEFLLHDIDPHGLVIGDTHDDQTGAALLSLAFENAARSSAPRGGCQRFARVLLAAHWPQVRAVADALLEHGTIDADQIRRAMDFPDVARTAGRATPALIGAMGSHRGTSGPIPTAEQT